MMTRLFDLWKEFVMPAARSRFPFDFLAPLGRSGRIGDAQQVPHPRFARVRNDIVVRKFGLKLN
jgi:hypothetical protein